MNHPIGFFFEPIQRGRIFEANGQARRVFPLPRDLDGIVLGTKNVGPPIVSLPEVSALGRAFHVQHGVSGRPRALELSIVSTENEIGHIEALADRRLSDNAHSLTVWRVIARI